MTDTTTPTIDNPPNIADFELGSTGNTITWNPNDLDPDYTEAMKELDEYLGREND